MAKANVAVFLTEQAHDTDPSMDYKVKNYLEAAFEYGDNQWGTPDVTIYNEPIPAPIENCNTKTEMSTCRSNDEEMRLLRWWEEYHKCHDSLTSAADSNVLVTDKGNLGGLAYRPGKYATAAGNQIKDLDKYSTDRYGSTTGHAAMLTVLSEIGHNFGLYHTNGYVYEVDSNPYMDSGYYETALMSGCAEKHDESYNRCDNWIPDIDTYQYEQHADMTYSNCSFSNMNL